MIVSKARQREVAENRLTPVLCRDDVIDLERELIVGLGIWQYSQHWPARCQTKSLSAMSVAGQAPRLERLRTCRALDFSVERIEPARS